MCEELDFRCAFRDLVKPKDLPAGAVLNQLSKGGVMNGAKFLPISGAPARDNREKEDFTNNPVSDDHNRLSRMRRCQAFPNRPNAAANVVVRLTAFGCITGFPSYPAPQGIRPHSFFVGPERHAAQTANTTLV